MSSETGAVSPPARYTPMGIPDAAGPRTYASMRRATSTSSRVAARTGANGTGCTGSSGSCRSTAARHSLISARRVGPPLAAGSPCAATTSWSGVGRSEYARPSTTTAYTYRPSPASTRTMAPIPTAVSSAVQKWNSCGPAGRVSVATTRPTITPPPFVVTTNLLPARGDTFPLAARDRVVGPTVRRRLPAARARRAATD